MRCEHAEARSKVDTYTKAAALCACLPGARKEVATVEMTYTNAVAFSPVVSPRAAAFWTQKQPAVVGGQRVGVDSGLEVRALAPVGQPFGGEVCPQGAASRNRRQVAQIVSTVQFHSTTTGLAAWSPPPV